MKVFIVVGSVFPFDRLVRFMDNWLPDHPGVTAMGQIGKAGYIPKNMEWAEKLEVGIFNNQFDEADLIVSHAGMGIILKSLVAGKPVVVMPRKLALGEHNTNHQTATAIAFRKMDYVHVAMDENELEMHLKNPANIKSKHRIEHYASPQLINELRAFICKR